MQSLMRLNHILRRAFLGSFVLGFALVGCQEEGLKEAQAVLTSETTLSFEAVSGQPQVINVYSDGSWKALVDQDWITVSPMSGDKAMEVTISVSDNVAGGEMDAPRSGLVIFRGASIERQGELTVKQKGDTYKGVNKLTLGEVAVLEDGLAAKIPEATVVAVTTAGFVLADNTGNLYVQGTRDVNIGDKVSLNGTKSTFNQGPSFLVDELTVTGSGSVSYPDPVDAQSIILTYNGGQTPYVKVSGSLVVDRVSLPPSTIQIIDAPESLGLEAVDIHKVNLYGYFVGMSGTTGYLVVTSFDDLGIDESLNVKKNDFIQWGFSAALMGTYKSAFEKGGSLPANLAGTGYISWNSLPENVALDAAAKKSQMVDGAGQPYVTGAWPGDYWEFSIPLYNVTANASVLFSALHQISGTGQKYWKMVYSFDGIEWTPARALESETETGTSAQYTHIAATTETRIEETIPVPYDIEEGLLRIRFVVAANWQGNGGALAAPDSGTHRWAGDEGTAPVIKVVKTFFEDDFSWLLPYADDYIAQNEGVTPQTMDPVGSDLSSHTQPGVWKVESLTATLGVEFTERGYVDLNPSVQTLYLQYGYFKMGASGKPTGLRLPPIDFGVTPTDAVISFNWCAHMSNAGKIDGVTIVAELEGPGKCLATGLAISEECLTTQENGNLEWQDARVALTGVTSDTRILLRPTHMSDGQGPNSQRWHLDNIRITNH